MSFHRINPAGTLLICVAFDKPSEISVSVIPVSKLSRLHIDCNFAISENKKTISGYDRKVKNQSWLLSIYYNTSRLISAQRQKN